MLLRTTFTGAFGAKTEVFGTKTIVACDYTDFRISFTLGLFLQFLSRHRFISVFTSGEKLADIVDYLPFRILNISAP